MQKSLKLTKPLPCESMCPHTKSKSFLEIRILNFSNPFSKSYFLILPLLLTSKNRKAAPVDLCLSSIFDQTKAKICILSSNELTPLVITGSFSDDGIDGRVIASLWMRRLSSGEAFFILVIYWGYAIAKFTNISTRLTSTESYVLSGLTNSSIFLTMTSD